MIGNQSWRRQRAAPLWVDDLTGSKTAKPLESIPLDRPTKQGESFSELWLQELICRIPDVLPIAELDPGIGPLVPICMELPVSSGYADNLLVSVYGDIVIVECKLWRNPEARREVVAQVIDYAQAMASWTYADLDEAVRKARFLDGAGPPKSIYELVAKSNERLREKNTELDEAGFVDAITRNLRRGRMLLLVVGDGIREGAETLGEYLQLHAGFHFAFGLVEMPVFELPAGGYLVQPRVLARTVNIERGIVRIDDGRVVVEKMPADTRPAALRVSPSRDRLVETIAGKLPAFPAALRAFEMAAGEHGIFTEPAPKSLMVRWPVPNDKPFSLGGFNQDGEFDTETVNWRAKDFGLLDLAHEHLEGLARLVGGTVRKTKKPGSWYVVMPNRKRPSAMDILQRRDDWIKLIIEYGGKLDKELRTRAG